MFAALQSAIPDVWLGEDGTLTIIVNIEAGQIEGLYLANQVVLEDSFIQTASLSGLQRWGEQFGVPQITGTEATGSVLFSGQGGVYIPIGSEVDYDPGAGADPLYYVTTQDGTIPNPGVPTAPTAADASIAGALTGTYEYVVTFLTAEGETVAGAYSNAVTVSASKINVTNIPLGGPGTTGRQVYRSLNAGPYQFVEVINDNTTTTWLDNQVTPLSPEVPQTVSTAEQILLGAQAEQSGVEYNAVAGAITELTNVPDGITAVTNPSPFINGSDDETTDAYRTRLLNWIRGPQTGAPIDLVNWAETVPGVSSATAFPNFNNTTPAPGYVTIRIAGPNGTIPGADVVAATLDLLQTKNLANITIVVSTFTAQSQAVAVTLTPQSGFTTVQLTPSVQEAISNYIYSIPAGGTLYISSIVAAVIALAGVADAVVTTPATNQTTTSDKKFIPGTITVS